VAEGLEQLDGYLAGLGLNNGWLVMFDRRTAQPPIAALTLSQGVSSPQGSGIQVVRT